MSSTKSIIIEVIALNCRGCEVNELIFRLPVIWHRSPTWIQIIPKWTIVRPVDDRCFRKTPNVPGDICNDGDGAFLLIWQKETDRPTDGRTRLEDAAMVDAATSATPRTPEVFDATVVGVCGPVLLARRLWDGNHHYLLIVPVAHPTAPCVRRCLSSAPSHMFF